MSGDGGWLQQEGVCFALASIGGRYDYLLGETGTYSAVGPSYLNTLSRMRPAEGTW